MDEYVGGGGRENKPTRGNRETYRRGYEAGSKCEVLTNLTMFN